MDGPIRLVVVAVYRFAMAKRHGFWRWMIPVWFGIASAMNIVVVVVVAIIVVGVLDSLWFVAASRTKSPSRWWVVWTTNGRAK